jgi:hypothetical protein
MSSIHVHSERSAREALGHTLKAGDKVRTRRDFPFWWTVQVAGSRYVILSRQAQFKPKGEYVYSICDLEEGVRGPTNYVGNGWDVSRHKTPEQGWRDLHIQLLAGNVEISHRNRVSMDLFTEAVAA